MTYVYTGAPDECSPCFVQGTIQKLDKNGKCPTHTQLEKENGYSFCEPCKEIHHYMYLHCAAKVVK